MRANNKRSSKKQKTENSLYYEIKGHGEVLFACNKNQENTSVKRLNVTVNIQKYDENKLGITEKNFSIYSPVYYKNKFDTPFYFFTNIELYFIRAMTDKEYYPKVHLNML